MQEDAENYQVIVKKFGGTSVANIDRIQIVAEKIESSIKALGDKTRLVIVVSAMAKVTDQLVNYCKEVSKLNSSESFMEYNSVVASGEQVTAGLLALTLQSKGIAAVSMLGWQAGIITDSGSDNCQVLDVKKAAISAYLKENKVVVVAGFQGVDEKGRITTLGRGGSDTTAALLAVALKAKCCEIYTDVDGIYTADPNVVKEAKRIDYISYEEILEMASLGAKVMHPRAVCVAMLVNMPIAVLSSFNSNEDEKICTMILSEEEIMEKSKIVSGVVAKNKDVLITIIGVNALNKGIIAKIFNVVSGQGIVVDIVLQSIARDGKFDVSFTVNEKDYEYVLELLQQIKENFKEIVVDSNISVVSIVGAGMNQHSGVASQMFSILSDNQIDIKAITTSEIKISVVVERANSNTAVKLLHAGFRL